METNKISIILPTYNEKDNIVVLIEEITKELEDRDYEIIVVDDNSPDGTSDKVEEAMRRFRKLRLLTRTSNRGLVPSVKDGIKMSAGNVCIWMDADLSMSPSLIKQIERRINLGADLVLGSRYIPGGGMKGADISGGKTSFFRLWKNLYHSEDSYMSAMISKYGNKLLRLILHDSINDYSSGYFGVKREVLETIELHGGVVDYCITLVYKAKSKGLNIVEIPMRLAPRKKGISKTSSTLIGILSVAFQCYKTALKLKFNINGERGRRL
ncbi:TPA: hypothetical protein DE059_04185 [Candidatus Peribacteria bacterium]|nr:hypothetical protein [Candidatus Peribacteria bacterium]